MFTVTLLSGGFFMLYWDFGKPPAVVVSPANIFNIFVKNINNPATNSNGAAGLYKVD